MLEEQIKTYTTSLVRTVVPILVGHLLGWLTLLGVPLPETVGPTLSGLLVLVIGAFLSIGYYALFRWLEQKWPAFGIFLGKAQAPIGYSATPEDDKRTIGIALEATRDREPDEEGEAVDVDWDGPDPAVPHRIGRHRAGSLHRADGEPV
jgi:hypothetical protein